MHGQLLQPSYHGGFDQGRSWEGVAALADLRAALADLRAALADLGRALGRPGPPWAACMPLMLSWPALPPHLSY